MLIKFVLNEDKKLFEYSTLFWRDAFLVLISFSPMAMRESNRFSTRSISLSRSVHLQ